jgi:hypothetical protein
VLQLAKIIRQSRDVHHVLGQLVQFAIGHTFWRVGVFERTDLETFVGVEGKVAALLEGMKNGYMASGFKSLTRSSTWMVFFALLSSEYAQRHLQNRELKSVIQLREMIPDDLQRLNMMRPGLMIPFREHRLQIRI